MDSEKMLLAEQEIDTQIARIERIINKRETAGKHLDDFLSEEKARLYGMLKVYWLFGGQLYPRFP